MLLYFAIEINKWHLHYFCERHLTLWWLFLKDTGGEFVLGLPHLTWRQGTIQRTLVWRLCLTCLTSHDGGSFQRTLVGSFSPASSSTVCPATSVAS